MASLADNVARGIKVFGDIKNAIIERGVSVENNTPVEEYPDKIRDVSLTNYNQGLSDGYSSGEADGRQAQYDEFWDEFQQNGKRTHYGYAFSGFGWTDAIFKPKYPLGSITNAYMMLGLSHIVDFSKADVDYSKLTGMMYFMYQNDTTKYLGEMDLSSIVELNQSFQGFALEKIEKIKNLKSNVNLIAPFNNTTKLTDITFENCKIGISIDFSYSPLNVKSMKSVIFSLVNYAGTDKANIYTVTFKNDCWVALEADEEKPPEGETWRDYVHNCLGWNT